MSTPTHTPGVFEAMSKWEREEILSWLNTVSISDARTLFESGARLEAQRDEMLAALKEVLNEFRAWQPELETDELTKPICDQIKAAIAKAERKPMVVHGAPVTEE